MGKDSNITNKIKKECHINKSNNIDKNKSTAWVFSRLQIKCIHDKINNKLQITRFFNIFFIIYLSMKVILK